MERHAPAEGVDERLRERHDEQHADADARADDADRKAEPFGELALHEDERRNPAAGRNRERREDAEDDVELGGVEMKLQPKSVSPIAAPPTAITRSGRSARTARR